MPPTPHKRTECHNRQCTQDECVDFRWELREDAREVEEDQGEDGE